MLSVPHAQRLNPVATAVQWEIGSCSPSVIPGPMKRGHRMLWDQIYISYNDRGFTY